MHKGPHRPSWHRFTRNGIERRVCNRCGLIEKKVHGQWVTERGRTITESEIERDK